MILSVAHGGVWEPSGCLAPPGRGGAEGQPDTHSVFGIDVQAQGQKVLHNLHVPRADCHVQGGAQQLRGEETGTAG